MKQVKDADYSEFYQTYTKKVPQDIDVLDYMDEDLRSSTTNFIKSLSADQLKYRYNSGKWSLSEVLGHIIDCERIFAYRSLSFVRKDKMPLPGFEENDYAIASNYNDMDSEAILRLYQSNRSSSIALFRSYSEEMWDRVGVANGEEMIALAIPYINAGHEIHHISVIKERYL